MQTPPGLVVREMQIAEVGIRIDYFHDSSDQYLLMLGVDRASLPSREAWRSSYEEDYARPIEDRESYLLIWELDGRTVGFSSTDRIVFGEEAFMHLHIVTTELRHQGYGTEFVKESARQYFRTLELERLFCEPNFLQATTRWMLDRRDLE
jgi:hypothetical protein